MNGLQLFVFVLPVLAVGLSGCRSTEAILADYLFTNECLKDEIANMLETLKRITKGTNVANSGRALIEAREEYLLAAFDEIDRQYGSMDAFLEQGLGVDAAMKARFRAKYLE